MRHLESISTSTLRLIRALSSLLPEAVSTEGKSLSSLRQADSRYSNRQSLPRQMTTRARVQGAFLNAFGIPTRPFGSTRCGTILALQQVPNNPPVAVTVCSIPLRLTLDFLAARESWSPDGNPTVPSPDLDGVLLQPNSDAALLNSYDFRDYAVPDMDFRGTDFLVEVVTDRHSDIPLKRPLYE